MVVSKFSNQFKTILAILKPLNVSAIGLNHSPPKRLFRKVGLTKGVEADHVKIFQLPSSSFAFSFYSKSEPPFIAASFKTSDGIVSAHYSEETFRTKLNQFVTFLKILDDAKALSLISVEATFTSNFTKGNKLSPEVEAKKISDSIRNKIKDLELICQTNLELETSLVKEIDLKKTTYKKEVKKLREKSGALELQEKLNVALKKTEAEESKLYEEMNNKVRQLEDKHWTIKNEISIYNSKVEKLFHNQTLGQDKVTKNLVAKMIYGNNKNS